MSESNIDIIIEIMQIFTKATEEEKAKILSYSQNLIEQADDQCQTS